MRLDLTSWRSFRVQFTILLRLGRCVEPLRSDVGVSAPQLNVPRVEYGIRCAFGARSFDQYRLLRIFNKGGNILRGNERIVFLVDSNLRGFKPFFGIVYYR